MPDYIVPIIVAVITGAFAVIGQVLLSRANSQKMLAEMEKRSEISDIKIEGQIEKMQEVWRLQIEQLTASVNRHNGFAEKVPVLEEKIKVLNARVEDLERSVSHEHH